MNSILYFMEGVTFDTSYYGSVKELPLNKIMGSKYCLPIIILTGFGIAGTIYMLKPKVQNVQNPVQAVLNVAANTSDKYQVQALQPKATTQAPVPATVATSANTPLEARLDTLEKQVKDTVEFVGKPLGLNYYIDFNGDGHKDELIPYTRAGFIVNLNTGIGKKDETGKVILDKHSEMVGDFTRGTDSYTTERMHDTINDYLFSTEKYLTKEQVKIAYNNSPGTLCYVLKAAGDYGLWTKGENGTNSKFKNAYLRIAREIEQDTSKKIMCENANFSE